MADENENTPLHAAMINNHYDAVLKLLGILLKLIYFYV